MKHYDGQSPSGFTQTWWLLSWWLFGDYEVRNNSSDWKPEIKNMKMRNIFDMVRYADSFDQLWSMMVEYWWTIFWPFD